VDRIRLVERISDRPFSFRRCVLSVLLIVILLPAGTAAQASIYTGMLTPHVGMAHGGDIDDRGLTLGVSLTAVETGGIGAELDLSHARQFDDSRFAESGITALMVNVIGMFPDETVRPFVVAGVGLLRVRASLADGEAIASRTDWGFDAGGGPSAFAVTCAIFAIFSVTRTCRSSITASSISGGPRSGSPLPGPLGEMHWVIG
jgi:opacity protein-like surface antigen